MVNHTGFKRIYITTTQTYNNNNNNNNNKNNNNNNNDNIYIHIIDIYIYYIYNIFFFHGHLGISGDLHSEWRHCPPPGAPRATSDAPAAAARPNVAAGAGGARRSGPGRSAMAVAATGPCLNHGKYGEKHGKTWKSVAKWDPKWSETRQKGELNQSELGMFNYLWLLQPSKKEDNQPRIEYVCIKFGVCGAVYTIQRWIRSQWKNTKSNWSNRQNWWYAGI